MLTNAKIRVVKNRGFYYILLGAGGKVYAKKFCLKVHAYDEAKWLRFLLKRDTSPLEIAEWDGWEGWNGA
jgi:hypothetical protein